MPPWPMISHLDVGLASRDRISPSDTLSGVNFSMATCAPFESCSLPYLSVIWFSGLTQFVSAEAPAVAVGGAIAPAQRAQR